MAPRRPPLPPLTAKHRTRCVPEVLLHGCADDRGWETHRAVSGPCRVCAVNCHHGRSGAGCLRPAL
jgi:hypothetical protein